MSKPFGGKPKNPKPKKIWVLVKTQIFWSKLLKKNYSKIGLLPIPKPYRHFFGYECMVSDKIKLLNSIKLFIYQV